MRKGKSDCVYAYKYLCTKEEEGKKLQLLRLGCRHDASVALEEQLDDMLIKSLIAFVIPIK